jgi:hypothetical protein
MARFLGYGLTIESDFDVPGATVLAACAEPPDITVREGPAPILAEGPRRGLFQLSEGRIVIDWPGGRFVCEAGATITFEAAPNGSARDVSAALIVLALPALLWMRGDIVLHASAAVLPGERSAVVFLGPSGAGKSTILRRLLAEGAAVVADDTVRVTNAAERLLVSGLPALIWDADHSDASGRGAQPVPELARIDAAPLGAFCLLADRAPARPEGPAWCLEALLASRYRAHPARLLGLVPAMLPRLGRIAQSTPFLDAVPCSGSRRA